MGFGEGRESDGGYDIGEEEGGGNCEERATSANRGSLILCFVCFVVVFLPVKI